MQVGNTGEEDEWKVLYEKENDPEAQVLEVPNLTPFTHYRSVHPHHREELLLIRTVLFPSVVFFSHLSGGV